MSNLSTLNDALLGAKYSANRLSEGANLAYFLERHSEFDRRYYIKDVLDHFDALASEVDRIRAQLAGEDRENAA